MAGLTDRGRQPPAKSDQVLLVASVVWAAFLFVVYRLQPDALAALTFWPVWGWALVGLLLLLPVLRRGWRSALGSLPRFPAAVQRRRSQVASA